MLAIRQPGGTVATHHNRVVVKADATIEVVDLRPGMSAFSRKYKGRMRRAQ